MAVLLPRHFADETGHSAAAALEKESYLLARGGALDSGFRRKDKGVF